VLVAPPVGLRPPYAATSTNGTPAIPVTPLDKRGPFWTPIGGPFWTPIDIVIVNHADAVLGRDDDLLHAVAAWEARTPEAVRLREVRRSFVEQHPELYGRR